MIGRHWLGGCGWASSFAGDACVWWNKRANVTFTMIPPFIGTAYQVIQQVSPHYHHQQANWQIPWNIIWSRTRVPGVPGTIFYERLIAPQNVDGKGSYLELADGNHLWIEPQIKESTILAIKNQMAIYFDHLQFTYDNGLRRETMREVLENCILNSAGPFEIEREHGKTKQGGETLPSVWQVENLFRDRPVKGDISLYDVLINIDYQIADDGHLYGDIRPNAKSSYTFTSTDDPSLMITIQGQRVDEPVEYGFFWTIQEETHRLKKKSNFTDVTQYAWTTLSPTAQPKVQMQAKIDNLNTMLTQIRIKYDFETRG